MQDRYKVLRNKLRRFRGESIIEAALGVLSRDEPDRMKRLQEIPWHLMLLVKWTLQDSQVFLRVGPDISPDEFHGLRQDLWNLQGEMHSASAPSNVFLMLRSLLYVQLEFQRPRTLGFCRWPALLARLDPAHACRVQFREEFGMEPLEYIDTAFLLIGILKEREGISPRYQLSQLQPDWRQKFERLLSLFSRSLIDLRHELRGEDAQRTRGKGELFEFPYLKRFPLLKLPDGSVRAWHSVVTAVGLEEATHLLMSRHGERYTRPFSRVFEAYIVELARWSGKRLITEQDFKKVMGEKSAAVEAIMPFSDCNVLIEAKLALFPDEVMVSDQEDGIRMKTKRVRKAFEQGWKVSKTLFQNPIALNTAANSTEDFLLVITSRNLLIGGGEGFQRLLRPEDFDFPDAEIRARLPLKNIFVVAVDDFENLMGSLSRGEIELPEFLRRCSAANSDPSTGRLFLSDHLAGKSKKFLVPELLENVVEESMMRLELAF